MEVTKRCPICEKVLPVTEFCKNKASKDGLQYYCRACMAAMNKKWYNKQKQKAARQQKKQSTIQNSKVLSGIELMAYDIIKSDEAVTLARICNAIVGTDNDKYVANALNSLVFAGYIVKYGDKYKAVVRSNTPDIKQIIAGIRKQLDALEAAAVH